VDTVLCLRGIDGVPLDVRMVDQAERKGRSIVPASRKEREVLVQCVHIGRTSVKGVSV
jgi:hypothetical protein